MIDRDAYARKEKKMTLLLILAFHFIACQGFFFNSLFQAKYPANVGHSRPATLLGEELSLAETSSFEEKKRSGRFLSCSACSSQGLKCCCEGSSLDTCHASNGRINCFNPFSSNCCGCISGACYTCDADESCVRHSYDYSCVYNGSGGTVYVSGGDTAGIVIGIFCLFLCCGAGGWWNRRRRYAYTTISSGGYSSSYQTYQQPTTYQQPSYHHSTGSHHHHHGNVGHASSAQSRPANTGYAASAGSRPAQSGYAASAY